MAGVIGTQSSASNIWIDTTGPSDYSIYSPTNWVNGTTPTVIGEFVILTQGVDPTTVQYAFSLTGSQTPSVWLNVDGVYLNAACTVPAYSGAIGVIYAEVDQVPFNQDSSGNVNRNTIRFRAANTLGTLTTQANAAAIDINTSSPTSLTVVSPTGWVSSQQPNVITSFSASLSGVNTSAVYFAYSTTGSSTPTNWANVTGVYTDASCQNLAADGATGTLYALIGNVPFNQDSASQNTIRISVTKNNGMQSIQAAATVIQVDSIGPNIFILLSPKNWTTQLDPTIWIQFNTGVSGINLSSVLYAYSITGSQNPNNWTVVTNLFTDSFGTTKAYYGYVGLVYAEMTVPFNQESTEANTFRIQASGMSGTLSIQSTITIKIDATPPKITILNPTANQLITAPPSFQLSIIENNLNQIWYTIDNGKTNYTVSGLTGTIDPTAWNNAPYGAITIQFYVIDLAGNMNTASVVVNKISVGEQNAIIAAIIVGSVAATTGIILIILRKKNKIPPLKQWLSKFKNRRSNLGTDNTTSS